MLSEYLSQNEVSSFSKYLENDFRRRILLATAPFSQCSYNKNFFHGLLNGCLDFLNSTINLPYTLFDYSFKAAFSLGIALLALCGLILLAGVSCILSPLFCISDTFRSNINEGFNFCSRYFLAGLVNSVNYAIDCPIEFTSAVLTLGARTISTLLFIVTLGHFNPAAPYQFIFALQQNKDRAADSDNLAQTDDFGRKMPSSIKHSIFSQRHNAENEADLNADLNQRQIR